MNLYLRVVLIIYLNQFSICEKLNIEPKINKTFLNIPLHYCYQYNVFFQDFFKEIKKVSNFSSHNHIIEVETFYNPELLNDRGPEEMGELSYVYLQYYDILQKVTENFRGLGILNYTTWNPIFRQNRGPLEYYYNHSISIETEMYPLINDDLTRKIAQLRFEFASENIITHTLAKVTSSWPQATWGLFDYPKCYSLSNEDINIKCDKDVIEDNDRLSWLWDFKIPLFPFISLPTSFTKTAKQNYVNARLSETKRIAEKYDPPLNIVPYISLNYRNDIDTLLSFVDLYRITEEMIKMNVSDNIIFWVADKNLNSKEKCQDFAKYLDNELAPIIIYLLNKNSNG